MFTTTGIGGRTTANVRDFMLDTPDDINLLPTQTALGKSTKYTVDNQVCGTGSSAFIISTSQLFMLNSEGIWCEV